jgi:hypothetical protein
MRLRARKKLPLHVQGDRQGTRKLNDVQPSPARCSRLERAVLAAITDQPVTSRQLAEQIGCPLGHNLRRALMQLHKAAVLEYDRRSGWKLAAV